MKTQRVLYMKTQRVLYMKTNTHLDHISLISF